MGEIGKVTPPAALMEMGKFYQRDGKVYCFSPTCEKCEYADGCAKERTTIKVGPGTNIRRAFRSAEGWGLAAIDFKQIEIRVAAQLSQEPFWIDAFNRNLDLHTAMARTGWKIPETQDVPKHIRDAAKACNFGNLFLGTPQTLCAQSSLTLTEAVGAHKIWWATVSKYKEWTEKQIAFYKKHGYVKTFFGRRREMDYIIALAREEEEKSGKKGKWGFCDRTSVNSPVQGTAADLMKLGMVKVGEWIRKEGLVDYLKICLTVHDELVIHYRKCAEQYQLLREIGRILTFTPKGARIPNIPNWVVPLGVDIEIGDNWAELTDIDVLDPEGAEPGIGSLRTLQDDTLILVITNLTETATQQLYGVIARAASSEFDVKVPLKVQMGGKLHVMSDFRKVHSPTVEEGIRVINGVSIGKRNT